MNNEKAEALRALSAKVTALTMLVEALYVDAFARSADPKADGNAIINFMFAADEKVRRQVGESAFALQISEALTSLIERAVARALLRQAKERRSR